MKKVYFLFLLNCVIGYITSAQNTFPPSGNVGIGTLNPGGKLTISMSNNGNLTGCANAAICLDQDESTIQGPGTHTQIRMGGNLVLSAERLMSLSTYDVQPITFNTNNTERMRIDGTGNVGIGTAMPTTKLNMPISTNGQGISLGAYNTMVAGSFSYIGITGADGTFNGGNLSSGDNGAAGLAFVHTAGGIGNSTELAFITHNNGADSRERVRIDRFGNVGIGTNSPSEKLSVNGNIRSKKIIVTQTGWADYVFNDRYRLRPLAEIESFIKENKHLPEVPSAKEVCKNGIDVGETEVLLLKKIEELTLYMIEQKKEISSMKKENREMKHRLKKIENKP